MPLFRGRRRRVENEVFEYRSGWTDLNRTSDILFNVTESESEEDNSKKDTRKTEKPVNLVKGLISEEDPIIGLDNIKERIKVVEKRKAALLKLDGNITDEELALSFLYARLKYKKCKKKFQWQITTKEKVDALCKEYKVILGNLRGYSKTLPDEALAEIEKFEKIYTQVTKDKPIYKLIVDHGGPEHKKDPILLAESPFGKWYYILGAWDKEVQFVDELVYGSK